MTNPEKTMIDDYAQPCTETRKLPLAGGGNAIVGYKSFLKEMEFWKEIGETEFPEWESLEIYFKDGKPA